MSCKIAVILDDNKNTTSLENASSVGIYEKLGDGWVLKKHIFIDICFDNDMSLIRQSLTDLAEKINDSKIIAGRSVTGLIFNIFDRLGFYIFEIENHSERIFDSIIKEIEGVQNKKQEVTVSKEPIEVDIQGYYFLDLSEVLKQNPPLSSKKILQPFFDEKPFVQLELICSHLPPWIEINPALFVKTELVNGKIKATISKKACNKI
jgi:Fe-only nitrogenase accessory protein AnfO